MRQGPERRRAVAWQPAQNPGVTLADSPASPDMEPGAPATFRRLQPSVGAASGDLWAAHSILWVAGYCGVHDTAAAVRRWLRPYAPPSNKHCVTTPYH